MTQTLQDTLQAAFERYECAKVEMTELSALIEQAGQLMRDDGTVKPSLIAESYFHIKQQYEELDTLIKKVYHVQDMLNKHLIPERLQANGLDMIRVPTVARSFSIVAKTSASFVDRDAGLAWLREIGQGDMIQETVNAGTLSAFCRNLVLEQGIDPPTEIVKVSTYNTTSMVKYRPKAGEV